MEEMSYQDSLKGTRFAGSENDTHELTSVSPSFELLFTNSFIHPLTIRPAQTFPPHQQLRPHVV